MTTNGFAPELEYIEYEVRDGVAFITMNRPDEEREAAPKWIQSRQQVSAERLKMPGPIVEAERS